MYQQVESPEFFIDKKGNKRKPLASVEFPLYGLVHICKDNSGNYHVFWNIDKNGYAPVEFWWTDLLDFLYSFPDFVFRPDPSCEEEYVYEDEDNSCNEDDILNNS